MIKNINQLRLIRNVLLKGSVSNATRSLSSTGYNSKKYKYALTTQGSQKNTTGGSASKGGKPRKNFVYGEKTVTYFSLDGGEGEEEGGRLFNPKQKVYSEYIEDAVKDLLVSSEVDQELKDSSIDVVDVEVTDSLATAYVIWRISEDAERQSQTKEDVKELLNKNLSHLRLLLPAFTSLTNPPTIHFVYDTVSERKTEFVKLLDTVKLEIENHVNLPETSLKQ